MGLTAHDLRATVMVSIVIIVVLTTIIVDCWRYCAYDVSAGRIMAQILSSAMARHAGVRSSGYILAGTGHILADTGHILADAACPSSAKSYEHDICALPKLMSMTFWARCLTIYTI